jgi:polysaccharide biosynthesis/export protein
MTQSLFNVPCLLLLLSVLLLGSCVQHRDLVAFQAGAFNASLSPAEQIASQTQLEIQPDDVLQITINTADDATSRPFNIGGGDFGGGNQNFRGGAGNIGAFALNGYLVDSLGFIDFPVVGRVKVGGLTLDETRNVIADSIAPYLKDPAINIRFLNFRFTVLGEVNGPGTITVFNKRITLLEALGQVGDLTPYANRGRILVIREIDGRRVHGRVNLEQGDIFNSPFFYLKQNDVIYVEPIQAKIATVADPLGRALSYGSAVLSLAAVILALVR